MTRNLPNSDISVSGWSSTAASVWQAVANLVPDNCPGADHVSRVDVSSGSSSFFEVGLPDLATIPGNCKVLIYANATAGGFWNATVKQGGIDVFIMPDVAMPASAGVSSQIMEQFLSPGGTTGWKIQVSVDTSVAGTVTFYGVEVDFDVDGGSSGPGGQLGQNATFLLLMMDNDE